jgi:hypothetical protein
VQDVTVEIGLSTRATFTGPGFATNAAASDALRNLQVSPPPTGADVFVAAGVVSTAVVAPAGAVATALGAAPTGAAAPALELAPLALQPAMALARASRTAQVMSLFMFDSFTRYVCTAFRRSRHSPAQISL